jgi:hypothetical protein
MNTKGEYIPGTCNIGPDEIKRRGKSAVFSALLAIAIIILLLMIHVAHIWRLALFFPATSVGIGFQQWYNKFCVGFGLKGLFNFGEIGKTYSVEQKEYMEKDRKKARKMITIGIVFGLAIAILFYLLPL